MQVDDYSAMEVTNPKSVATQQNSKDKVRKSSIATEISNQHKKEVSFQDNGNLMCNLDPSVQCLNSTRLNNEISGPQTFEEAEAPDGATLAVERT